MNVILCCQCWEYIKDKAQFHSGTPLATGIISVICIFVSMQHVPEGLKAPLKIDAVDWLSGDWLCIWVWSPTFSGRTIYKEDMVFEFTDKCSVIVPLCLNIQSVSYRWSGMGYLLSYARMQYWWHLAQGFSNTLIRALTNNTHVLNDYTHGPFVMVKQLSGPLRSPLADFNLGVIKSHPVFLNNVNSSDKVK